MAYWKYNKNLKIPYIESNGSERITTYLGYNEYGKKCLWSDNSGFRGTLKFDRFSRGRSSVKAHFVSLDGNIKCEMFLKDFEDILKSGKDIFNLNGEFHFRKAGMNCGVILLEE